MDGFEGEGREEREGKEMEVGVEERVEWEVGVWIFGWVMM